MDFQSFDLNLLRVFDRLVSERKVSAAAESLGLTQPAVSNALKRLREITGDELFTRTSTGMQPTPYAMQIAEPICYAIATIEGAFSGNRPFDASTSERTFTLGLTDIGEAYILPRLLEQCRDEAPGVDFTALQVGPDSLREAMEKGQVDIAVGLLPSLQGNFFRRRMMQQRYVVCMRAEHPLANKSPWTIDDFMAQEHVVVAAPRSGHGAVEVEMIKLGLLRRIRLTIPHYLAIGPILSHNDVVCTVPETLVRILASHYGLVSTKHPVTLPRVSIDVFWHRRQQRDPGNIWLRSSLYRLYGAGS